MPTLLQKIWKGSPNFWQGRKSYKPEAIVIHIMAGTIKSCDSWFANVSSQVSAHYGVAKSGEVHQYVKEENTAWHAGVLYQPSWKLLKPNVNPNLYTIGIEHEGQPEDIWTEQQKQASASLIREACQQWQIPLDRDHIIGHYQITTKKPNDPAVNKGIIDELISLAKTQASPATPSEVAEGIKKIEEGLALIKKSL